MVSSQKQRYFLHILTFHSKVREISDSMIPSDVSLPELPSPHLLTLSPIVFYNMANIHVLPSVSFLLTCFPSFLTYAFPLSISSHMLSHIYCPTACDVWYLVILLLKCVLLARILWTIILEFVCVDYITLKGVKEINEQL